MGPSHVHLKAIWDMCHLGLGHLSRGTKPSQRPWPKEINLNLCPSSTPNLYFGPAILEPDGQTPTPNLSPNVVIGSRIVPSTPAELSSFGSPADRYLPCGPLLSLRADAPEVMNSASGEKKAVKKPNIINDQFSTKSLDHIPILDALDVAEGK